LVFVIYGFRDCFNTLGGMEERQMIKLEKAAQSAYDWFRNADDLTYDAKLVMEELCQALEFYRMVQKGTKAWGGVDSTKWVEELRGND
jgi:hypothetical protein